MNSIVIHTGGTLGDHLPFLALGRALADRGHGVKMVINQAMHPFAQSLGLPAEALTDVERGAEEARANAWSWDHWSHDPQEHPKAQPMDPDEYVMQAAELIELSRGADLFITTSIRSIGYVAQAALGLPWLTVSVMPLNFWRPASEQESLDLMRRDLEEHAFLTRLLTYTFSQLGIQREPPRFSRGLFWAPDIILASSPHFSRPDPGMLSPFSLISQTGFWFFEDPAWAAWRPDDELRAFFDRPPERAPLVFGFSSIPVEDTRRILEPQVRAAALLDRPLLVLSGWAGFGQDDLPPDCPEAEVLFREFLPQDWIFARAGVSLQHGGIGSIARALRQGYPVLVEPMGNDQLYNATRVHDLGVGAAMHPFALTGESLAGVLAGKVLTAECRRRAADLGAHIRTEDGLGQACRLIEEFMEARPAAAKAASRPSAPGPREAKAARFIPRILHQTWKTADLPPDFQTWRETWLKRHPGWTIHLWTDQDNRAFLERHYPWFLPIWEGYPNPINRADTVRYFLLHHYGGVYADLDLECLKPLDDLLAGRDLVFGLEPEVHRARHCGPRRPLPYIVYNAWMASAPGHPFWEVVFRQLVASHKMPDPLDSTAVFMLTRAVLDYAGQHPVHLLPAERIYPIHDRQGWRGMTHAEREEAAREAYTVHHWKGTWWRPRLPEWEEEKPVALLYKGLTVGSGVLGGRESLEAAFRGRRPPLLSCLLVTGGPRGQIRSGLARRAVNCFRRQTYPALELVVVDDGAGSALGP